MKFLQEMTDKCTNISLFACPVLHIVCDIELFLYINLALQAACDPEQS